MPERDDRKPPKHDAGRFTIVAEPSDDLASVCASQFLRPEASAASTIRRFHSPAPDHLTVDALVAELDSQAKAVNAGDLQRGEAMLTAQAHTLDLIFAT